MPTRTRHVNEDGGSSGQIDVRSEPFLVSVIIPTHDRPDLLRRALGSVLTQTYERLEIIVVDDASKVDVAPIIAYFQDDRIRLLRHENNQGASIARNDGIADAKGAYVAFLDDDDEMFPDKIAAHMEDLAKKGWRYQVSYCLGEIYDDAKGITIRNHRQGWDGDHLEQLIDGTIRPPTICLLIAKECLQKVGGFRSNLPSMEDRELWIRLAEHYEFAFVNRILVRIHLAHGSRMSDNRQARLDAQSIIYRAQKELFWRHPKALSGFFMNYAFELLDCGYNRKALVQFIKAIVADPFVSRPYVAMGLGITRIVRTRA